MAQVQVDFYHLEHGGPETVLPRIAERVLGGGGRLLVVADEPSLIERIDEALWTWKPESFLPHGTAGRPGEAEQPILLSRTTDPVNGARLVVLADGLWREAALAFERAFLLFGGDAVPAAREAWKGLARHAALRNYWRQREGGGWEKMG